MSLDESKRELLAARDRRQAEIDRQLASGWPAIVALSLGIPGADKTPPGSLRLFGWAEQRLVSQLPDAKVLFRASDVLGPFSVWGARQPPDMVKEHCLAIETSSPAARLLDLDVYLPEGRALDRASLHLPPRTCLICEAPARECIRLGRHPWTELVSSAHALLLDFSA